MLFGAAATVLSPRLPQLGAAVAMQNSARLGRLGAFHVDSFRRSTVQSITIKPRFSKAHYFQVRSQMLSKQHPSGTLPSSQRLDLHAMPTTPYHTASTSKLGIILSGVGSSNTLGNLNGASLGTVPVGSVNPYRQTRCTTVSFEVAAATMASNGGMRQVACLGNAPSRQGEFEKVSQVVNGGR